MTDLAGLLARVRAARGPDRELDGDIANALSQAPEGFRRSKIRSNSMMWAEKTKSDWDHAERWDAPRYCGSIDAALALVERVMPGVHWRLTPKICTLFALPEDENAPITDGRSWSKATEGAGATPALAVCAALLTAIIAKEAKP